MSTYVDDGVCKFLSMLMMTCLFVGAHQTQLVLTRAALPIMHMATCFPTGFMLLECKHAAPDLANWPQAQAAMSNMLVHHVIECSMSSSAPRPHMRSCTLAPGMSVCCKQLECMWVPPGCCQRVVPPSGLPALMDGELCRYCGCADTAGSPINVFAITVQPRLCCASSAVRHELQQ